MFAELHKLKESGDMLLPHALAHKIYSKSVQVCYDLEELFAEEDESEISEERLPHLHPYWKDITSLLLKTSPKMRVSIRYFKN